MFSTGTSGNKQQTEQTKEGLEQIKLGNTKIGPKLFAGFGVVLILTAALGIVSYLQIGTMQDQSVVMENRQT